MENPNSYKTSFLVVSVVVVILAVATLAMVGLTLKNQNAVLAPQGAGSEVNEELRFKGSGQGEAQDIEYIGHDGKVRKIKSIQKVLEGGKVVTNSIVGNKFTFNFDAKQDKFGNVTGFMQLNDPELGLNIFATDFDISTRHLKHKIPSGDFEGPDALDMGRATTVFVNGKLQPEWVFSNEPMFVGKDKEGKDVFIVCFEIRQPIKGKLIKTFQWHAFVTEGEVDIIRDPDGPNQQFKLKI